MKQSETSNTSKVVFMQKAKKASKEELLKMLDSMWQERVYLEKELDKAKNHEPSPANVLGEKLPVSTRRLNATSPLESEDIQHHQGFDIEPWQALQNNYLTIISQLKKENHRLELQFIKQKAEIKQIDSNFRNIVDRDKDAIWLINKRYEVLECNLKFQTVFQNYMSEPPRKGSNVLWITPDRGEWKLWKAQYDKAFKGEEVSFNIQIQRRKEELHYKILVYPIANDGETVKKLAVFARNITDKVLAENKLKHSRTKLQMLLQQLPVIMATFDRKLHCTSIIGKGLQELGVLKDELEGESIFTLSRKYLGKSALIKVLKEGLNGRSGVYDLVFGSRKYLLYVEPVRNIHGDIESVVSLSMDITARKTAEEKLKRKNERLQKVNKELDQFVYSVSHDLRAPLTSVMGLINIALEEDDIEVIKSYLKLQQKSILKLDEFIQDIINLSRNARLDMHRDEIDFDTMLNALFETHQYAGEGKQVERRLKIHQISPFFSDNKRLDVVFSNLISNAIRYSVPELREAPFVEIEVKVCKKEAQIIVSDNGQGIQAEHLDKIFEMFYRATDKHNGSGLGLYIVKETIEKLAGNISVHSDYGKGTVFQVVIPNAV